MTIPSGLIGVVHLPPIPGDPRHRGSQSFDDALSFALTDAQSLVDGGVDAIIIENFGSAPFPKGTAGDRIHPHQVAFLARVATKCRARFDIPIGVNCLRNDAPAAVGIAAATNLDFIRVNIHTGAYVTDQGLIEGEAHRTLRYRRQLGVDDIAILADVFVKHAAPLVAIETEEAVQDTVQRGCADAIIVTGQATGHPVDTAFVQQVVRAANDTPIFIGSGLNAENASELAALSCGAIVGTYFKKGGQIHNPVDQRRVRQITDLAQGQFRQTTA